MTSSPFRNVLPTQALLWLLEHRQQVSISVTSNGQAWHAEANTPRVLASAQKIHVFAAVLEQAAEDSSILQECVGLEAVRAHHLPGTDAGAHELALAATGLGRDGAADSVTLSRLITLMLYYSSNAAADAIADVLQSRCPGMPMTATLPPRMSEQFRQAYPAFRPGSTDYESSVLAAGRLTYRNTTKYLVRILSSVVENRHYAPGKDAFAFLPYLVGRSEGGIRGKRGQLPGYRSGCVLRTDQDGHLVLGAYAVEGIGFRGASDRQTRDIEAAALGMAAGVVDGSFLGQGTTAAVDGDRC